MYVVARCAFQRLGACRSEQQLRVDGARRTRAGGHGGGHGSETGVLGDERCVIDKADRMVVAEVGADQRCTSGLYGPSEGAIAVNRERAVMAGQADFGNGVYGGTWGGTGLHCGTAIWGIDRIRRGAIPQEIAGCIGIVMGRMAVDANLKGRVVCAFVGA